ncbi:MAG: methyltransferase, TrmH family [Epulopiscium sp.]|nr:RNA methyltransferase [Defluviitalea raffinosedens]MDK2787229.1 methyltransferase, TrmH family [Candidatus Epulonipiscium sp.]
MADIEMQNERSEDMIESMQNRHIKRLVGLQKSKKNRNKEKAFVVEGIKIVEEIPKDWEIDSIFVASSFKKENPSFLDRISVHRHLSENEVIEVSDKIFNAISDTMTPQGVLAICRQKSFSLEKVLTNENGFYIILEDLQDPGNLGTIIRTGDALGADGIILTKGSVDLYNPKVIRSTMGSIFHLPILTDADINDLLNELRIRNISTLSAHLKGEKYPYQCDLRKNIALIIGNEANGIKDSTAQKTDLLVKIPMPGKAESLNAAMAAGILMYEVLRQRSNV